MGVIGVKTVRWAGVLVTLVLAGCEGCITVDTGCTSDTECASNETCTDGTCVARTTAQCMEDIDCGNGRVCVLGACQVRTNRADAGQPGPDGGGASSSSGVAGNGVLHLDPSSQLEFGDPLLNQDITRSALLRNDGTGPLQVLAVTRSSATSDEYTVATSVPLPTTLAVGAELRINVTYRLRDATVDVGYVAIRSDARDCTFNCPDATNVRLPLFAEFKGDKQLGINPTTHDFGFVETGMQSAPFTVEAENVGSRSRILTVQSVSITGAGAAHFDLDVTNLVLPALLSPGQTVQLPVLYRPLTMGTHQADLEVTADSDNPALVRLRCTLNGRSVPMVDLSADPINFGNLELNQQLVRPTTIHNNSNVSVTIQAYAFPNGQGTNGFYITTASVFPFTIPAGGTAPLDVTFRPTGTAGPRSDTLNLAHSLSATPVTVALSGVADALPPPPGGPGLEMVMTFNRHGIEQEGCGNLQSVDNMQNMDLILEAGGGTCEKPTQVGGSCPADNLCTCSFGGLGGATWRAQGGIAPEPYLEESITHNQSGGDGTFYVKNRYWEDCSDNYRSGAAAFMQAICGYGDVPPLRYYCFPREKFPELYVSCGVQGEPYNGYCISETQCLYRAATLDGRCGSRSGTAAKTVVTIKAANGTVVDRRAFCLPFAQANQANKADVVSLIREQGFFRFGTVASGVTTLPDVSATCPE